jgi:hypothetical protein
MRGSRLAAQATIIEISDDAITVQLSDGRTLAAPLVWFPRLLHGTTVERNDYRLIGKRTGIHWPLLDEDISVSNLLEGKRSQESQPSLKKWLES